MVIRMYKHDKNFAASFHTKKMIFCYKKKRASFLKSPFIFEYIGTRCQPLKGFLGPRRQKVYR